MSDNPTLERGPDEECLATWWVQATPGTTYWRCLVPARHLPGQALALETEKDIAVNQSENIVEMPRQRGTAVWQFLGDKNRTKLAMAQKIVQGTRTLMELDDSYLFEPPYLRTLKGPKPWYRTIEEAGETGYSYEMHRMLTPHMDALIVSTDFLADLYSEHHDEIYVCPNSLDMDDWGFERPEPDGILRIVYYGSISHSVDTPLVTKALKWASKQKDVEIHTVGFVPQDWSFDFHPTPWFNDLAGARESLFRFDIGVAPLKGTKWSNCKSDVKVLEYAAAGVLPLASNAVPYRGWDSSGILVNDGDWMEVIRHHVLNREQVSFKANAFREEVLAKRTIQDSIHLWRDAINA